MSDTVTWRALRKLTADTVNWRALRKLTADTVNWKALKKSNKFGALENLYESATKLTKS